MEKSYNALLAEFKKPSEEFGPVMMWFWKDVVTEEGITFQLEKMHEQNIVDFFVHPAVGLEVEYLSDRYMELIKHTVKEAKRLGMHYWIYDEYEYPSGTAGGQLVKKYPEYRQKELKVEDWDLCLQGMRICIVRKGTFVGAQLVNEKNGRTYATDISDQCIVTTSGEFTEVSYIYSETNMKGRGLFYFSEYNMQSMPSSYGMPDSDGTGGYVNMLSYDAVGKFIELTHERYKAAIGEEFGKTVRGIFTDEPTTLRHFDYSIAGPWSDTFAAEFEKEHGYSLLPYLYVLWSIEAKSPEEIKAQDDYRSTVKRLYYNNFMKQVSDWCRKNNLIYTGHFGGEEELAGHIFQGDMMEELMLFDMPGIDSIISSLKIETNEFNIAGKLGASAAKFMGSDRLLCETYTGSGWSIRLPDMKRIANRLLMLGVNMIQYMGAYYSIAGTNKNFPQCYAPSHSYNNTLFPYYNKLGNYIAAFSSLSAATKPDNNVLVFNPLRQMEHDYYMFVRDKAYGAFDAFPQRTYTDTLNALLYEGIGYDLFSENLIDNITVYDGYIEAYGYRYDTVVFPRMHYINTATKELIEKLRAHNVKMVFTYELPGVISDTGESHDFEFNMKPYNIAVGVESDGNAYLITPKEFPANMGIYRSAFRDVIGNPILGIQTANRVYISKRSNAEAEVYFICNDENVEARVWIDALPGMEILHSETREKADYTVESGRISLTITPYDMVAVLRDKTGTALPKSEAEPAMAETSLVLPDTYKFEAIDGNQLPLNYEMYDAETGLWDTCRFMFFSDHVHLGRKAEYKLRARVNMSFIPKKVCINAEIQRVHKLAVNGIRLSPCVNVQRWSTADYTGEITALLHEGENLIEIEGCTEDIARMNRPPFVFLSGNFVLDEKNTIITPSEAIEAVGWDKAGYPYYCGVGVYKTNTVVDTAFKKATLTVNTKDVAEIYVNGEYAGTKLWMPDETDITSLLRAGENEIEVRITSTFANLFACQWYEELSEPRTENGVLESMVIHLYG